MVFLTLTGRTLSFLWFLQIYRNKRAQQRYILGNHSERICLKYFHKKESVRPVKVKKTLLKFLKLWNEILTF